MEIFDIHHHLGSLSGGSLQEGDGWQERDYANRVRIMDANGVTQSAILAATGYIQADGIKDTSVPTTWWRRIANAIRGVFRWPAASSNPCMARAPWASWNG